MQIMTFHEQSRFLPRFSASTSPINTELPRNNCETQKRSKHADETFQIRFILHPIPAIAPRVELGRIRRRRRTRPLPHWHLLLLPRLTIGAGVRLTGQLARLVQLRQLLQS